MRQSQRKIKDWEVDERREIVKELHRIRSSNRLLSEDNVEFREIFQKMLCSRNHPDIVVDNTEVAFLYRKIEAFVRGFNQINFFRKSHSVPPDQHDQRRRPLVEGGYIMASKQ